MIEEAINELIIQMENHGLEFECDGPDNIGFWTASDKDGNRCYRTFKDWDEVKNFIDNNPIGEENEIVINVDSKKTKVIVLKKNLIADILSKVSDICDYAIENGHTKQKSFEELETMLNRLAN